LAAIDSTGVYGNQLTKIKMKLNITAVQVANLSNLPVENTTIEIDMTTDQLHELMSDVQDFKIVESVTEYINARGEAVRTEGNVMLMGYGYFNPMKVRAFGNNLGGTLVSNIEIKGWKK
jgi:hypothetical protein